MRAPRRLYLDSTGRKLVKEDHPDAAVLLAPEGHVVDPEHLRRAGLTRDDVEAHLADESEPEPQPAPEDEDPYDRLMRLTRAELDDAAQQCGVEKPKDMPNKEAVARAIADAQGGKPE